MSKTIFRIFDVIEHYGLSARQFDISIGAANGYSLRMRKNNASVGSDVIERIIKKYPKINLVWLITGEGSMFIKQNEINSTTYVNVNEFINNALNQNWSKEKNDLLEEIKRELENYNK